MKVNACAKLDAVAQAVDAKRVNPKPSGIIVELRIRDTKLYLDDQAVVLDPRRDTLLAHIVRIEFDRVYYRVDRGADTGSLGCGHGEDSFVVLGLVYVWGEY